jgi:hypothetical protein
MRKRYITIFLDRIENNMNLTTQMRDHESKSKTPHIFGQIISVFIN